MLNNAYRGVVPPFLLLLYCPMRWFVASDSAFTHYKLGPRVDVGARVRDEHPRPNDVLRG